MKTLLQRLSFAGMIILMTSCPSPLENLDRDPTILRHSFSGNSSNVSVQNTKFDITFSRPMDGSYSITHNLGSVDMSWISPETLRLALNLPLNYNQKYTLVLNPSSHAPGFKDLDGNALAADTEISFTTESDPNILPININVYSKLSHSSFYKYYFLQVEMENNTSANFVNIDRLECSGPGLDTPHSIDLSSVEIWPGRSSWQIYMPQGSQPGDRYAFTVYYDDGTTDSFESEIGNVFSTGPIITNMESGFTIPLAPTIDWIENGFFGEADAEAYCIQVEDYSTGERIWSKWFHSTPSNLSMAFNEDGKASRPLTDGNRYYVVLNAMGKSGSWTSHAVDVTADANFDPNDNYPNPRLGSTYPFHQESDVSIDSNLVIIFTEEMDRQSVENSFWMEDAGGNAVEGTITWVNESNDIMRFTPSGFLKVNTRYFFNLTTGAISLDGQSFMTESFTPYFDTITELPPLYRSYGPVGIGISPGRIIRIAFNEEMDEAAVEENFTLSVKNGAPVSGTFRWESASRTMEFHHEGLAYGTTYEVVLSAGARSTAGFYLDAPLTYEFTVVEANIPEQPLFSPSSGSYSSSVSVSLSTPTSGANIRYRTDGGIPTSTAGTLYTGPFTLTGSATVNAVAYTADATSSVASADYTITAPVLQPEIGAIIGYSIFDGISGEGVGNGDGIVNLNEEIDLKVELYNSGLGEARNITGVLTINSNDSADCSISDTSVSLSSISSKDSGILNDFDFDVHGIPPGKDFDFSLLVTYEDTSGNPYTFEDTFSINVYSDKPEISVDSNSLVFAVSEGKNNAADQQLTITNRGGGSLSWTIVGIPPWMSLSKTSNSASYAGESVTITVSVDGTTLTEGTLYDDIVIQSSDETNMSTYIDITAQIINDNPLIDIQTPSSGTSWTTGSTGTISWNAPGATSAVDITLMEEGSEIYTIARSRSNTGSYQWSDIPYSLSGGTFDLMVRDSSNGSIVGTVSGISIEPPLYSDPIDGLLNLINIKIEGKSYSDSYTPVTNYPMHIPYFVKTGDGTDRLLYRIPSILNMYSAKTLYVYETRVKRYRKVIEDTIFRRPILEKEHDMQSFSNLLSALGVADTAISKGNGLLSLGSTFVQGLGTSAESVELAKAGLQTVPSDFTVPAPKDLDPELLNHLKNMHVTISPQVSHAANKLSHFTQALGNVLTMIDAGEIAYDFSVSYTLYMAYQVDAAENLLDQLEDVVNYTYDRRNDFSGYPKAADPAILDAIAQVRADLSTFDSAVGPLAKAWDDQAFDIVWGVIDIVEAAGSVMVKHPKIWLIIESIQMIGYIAEEAATLQRGVCAATLYYGLIQAVDEMNYSPGGANSTALLWELRSVMAYLHVLEMSEATRGPTFDFYNAYGLTFSSTWVTQMRAAYDDALEATWAAYQSQSSWF